MIAGNLLLLVAALYFAAEALRSQSKVVVAYLSGKADALEEVLKAFQEKLLIGGQPSCRNMQNQKLLRM